MIFISKKWNLFILWLIFSLCIVGFASAAHGDGNGSKAGLKFRSQIVMTETKSAPSGAGSSGNPYVFETGVTYQFVGPFGGWADVEFVFENHSWGREENSYLMGCPMASWSKVGTRYSESKCISMGADTHWWGGYYEGSFSNPRSPSTGQDCWCYGDQCETFHYKVIGESLLVASFTYTPTSGYVPLTVTFTDTSTGSPTSWFWDFGDGGISREQNPVHVYTSPGTYYVSLTVSKGGESDTEASNNFITGSTPTPTPTPAPPVADFTGSPTSGTHPLTVQFIDTSTGSPTSWSWSFGDGGTSTAQDPSHVYDSPGDYTVTLTATNGDGSDSEVKTDYIYIFHIADLYGFEAEGPLNTAQTVYYVGSKLNSMGYNPSSGHIDDISINGYNQLKISDIFFFSGHSSPGRLQFYKDSSNRYTFLFADSIDNEPKISNMNSNQLSNLKLAVLLGCHTGVSGTSSSQGNLVQESMGKGANCVIGFMDSVSSDQADYWARKFYDRLDNRQNIRDSFDGAWWDVVLYYGILHDGGIGNKTISGDENQIIDLF